MYGLIVRQGFLESNLGVLGAAVDRRERQQLGSAEGRRWVGVDGGPAAAGGDQQQRAVPAGPVPALCTLVLP